MNLDSLSNPSNHSLRNISKNNNRKLRSIQKQLFIRSNLIRSLRSANLLNKDLTSMLIGERKFRIGIKVKLRLLTD